MGYNSLYPQILLTGKIIDKETLKPISAAHIRIQELNKTSLSDSSGDFSFSNITAQKVNILCLAEGYHSVSMSINFDSSSLQKRITIFLISNESITDTIDVSERYFKKGEYIHTSYNTAENEEIKKAPGTVEDVIKYFQTNAGVSIANDANNDLLVRGGSPIEDLTLMDGIEIINPNHYGPPGSTSGALSYINLKLIKDADFYSGGFPVK